MKKFWHRIRGRRSFRVLYDSPAITMTDRGPKLSVDRTVRMCYSTARSYAEVFSGEVVFDPAP